MTTALYAFGVFVPPNYALERSVKNRIKGAAGAFDILAPAAPAIAVAWTAQRGRWASLIDL